MDSFLLQPGWNVWISQICTRGLEELSTDSECRYIFHGQVAQGNENLRAQRSYNSYGTRQPKVSSFQHASIRCLHISYRRKWCRFCKTDKICQNIIENANIVALFPYNFCRIGKILNNFYNFVLLSFENNLNK